MRRTVSVLSLLTALACSACVPQGLAFRVDNRLHITAPRQNAVVRLPLTLSWTVKDFQVAQEGRQDGGSFAVFVDTTPMAPGKGIKAFRDEDIVCQGACNEDGKLAAHGIYTTTNTQIVITQLPTGDDKDKHRATVVLLDKDGKRIGESAFHVDFKLKGARS